MQARHLKSLWEIRFSKILNQEKESYLLYKRILEEHGVLLEGTQAKESLEGILKDNLRHVRVASRLVRMVRQKKTARGEA